VTATANSDSMAATPPAPFAAAENVCTVVSNHPVNARYNHLVLAAPPTALTARPGQFFHLLCEGVPGDPAFLRRPMSVYRLRPADGADGASGIVEFLYKVVGAGTRAMARLEPGGSFNILGPLGQGFHLDPGWRHVVIVARGVGLATLAPLADMCRRAGVGIGAILSAQSPELIMAEDVMEAVGAEVVRVTDTEGTSTVANVERLVRGRIAEGRADALFTCGSNRLLMLLQKIARQEGIPGQVALEQQMACGLGMCVCCVRQVRRGGQTLDLRVCREGPVFELEEPVSW
jgi:dihydroorotate dehydrogenase electron transfer subunit